MIHYGIDSRCRLVQTFQKLTSSLEHSLGVTATTAGAVSFPDLKGHPHQLTRARQDVRIEHGVASINIPRDLIHDAPAMEVSNVSWVNRVNAVPMLT